MLEIINITHFREDNSDADSGVPDLPPWRSRKESTNLSGKLTENLSSGFLTRSDIKLAVQIWEMARGLKFQI